MRLKELIKKYEEENEKSSLLIEEYKNQKLQMSKKLEHYPELYIDTYKRYSSPLVKVSECTSMEIVSGRYSTGKLLRFSRLDDKLSDKKGSRIYHFPFNFDLFTIEFDSLYYKESRAKRPPEFIIHDYLSFFNENFPKKRKWLNRIAKNIALLIIRYKGTLSNKSTADLDLINKIMMIL